MKGCTEMSEEKTKQTVFKHPKHTLGRAKGEYHFYTLWIMEILLGWTTLPLSGRSQKRTQVLPHICFYSELEFSRVRHIL